MGRLEDILESHVVFFLSLLGGAARHHRAHGGIDVGGHN
jgi:hypothetical protein